MQHCVDALCSHGLPHLRYIHTKHGRKSLNGFFYYFSLVIVPLRGLHRRKSVDQQNAAAIAEPLCGSINMNNISLNPIPHFGAISSAGCHAVLRTSWLHNYLNEVENKRMFSSLWKENLLRLKQEEITTNVPCIYSSKQTIHCCTIYLPVLRLSFSLFFLKLSYHNGHTRIDLLNRFVKIIL